MSNLKKCIVKISLFIFMVVCFEKNAFAQNLDDYYLDYVDEKIYKKNDGKIDYVSEVFFEIEEYIKKCCENSVSIVDSKNRILNDKNVKKARTFKNMLVIAKQDSKDYKNDSIEFYDSKLGKIKEIKGYCYFVNFEEENALIIKHRYNNLNLYEDNTDIENLWYKEEVLYGYNIVDSDLNMLFDIPVSSISCKYKKDDDSKIDDEVFCSDFYKSYIYDMKKRKIVKNIDGVDYKRTFLNDEFAMMIDSIDLKDGKIKIIISKDKYQIIDDKYNLIYSFGKNEISFTNKNYDYLKEVILMEDKKINYFDKIVNDNKEEKNRFIYWSVDGSKIAGENELVKILGYGYYVSDYEKYDISSKEEGEVLKLELKNIDKNKNKILNVKLSKDEHFNINKFRINRFFGKEYYYHQQNYFFSDYYNVYDMNSNLMLEDIRYREIYIEEPSKNFKNGLLILESGKEKDDNSMGGILYYVDKDFNEVKEKTDYSTSLSGTRVVRIGDSSFLLFTSKGMEHLMSLTSLNEFKYNNYPNFNSIYFIEDKFELVWNNNTKIVVDKDFNILSCDKFK